MSLKLAHTSEQSPPSETVTAESLGRQLRAMLPPIRLHSLSLYNAEGDNLWLSEGALGPDEHSVVLDAIQVLHADGGRGYLESSLEDGRFAMFLPVRAPKGDLVGMVMLLTESRTLPAGTKEQLAHARIRGMLQKIAVFLRVGSTRAGETTSTPVLPAAAAPSAPAPVTDAHVDELLTIEFAPDPDATMLAPPAARQRIAEMAPAAATLAAPSPAPIPPPAVAAGSDPSACEATVIAPAHLLAETVLAASLAAAKAPQSAADTAADVTLSVQELVKMRSSGRTRRYEVLARSRRDAARNSVPPAFVASSANGSEGAALDGVVVHQLIDWLKVHPQIWDGEPASFSVNVSIGTLEDPGYLERVAAALKAADVPAQSLGFEITEFACVQCKSQVQRFITACERMGCFVVLDNFTFDSAALAALGSKAVRMVKIDPRLTTAAMKERLPQAVVIAILQACKVLGVHCIAKNVETQAALDWLQATGCDFAQGYALEKPLSLESLASPSPTLPRVKGKDGKSR